MGKTEYSERWRPLREALRAIAEDDSSCLLRVAPEIRQPAEEIVAMLLPDGSRLGGAFEISGGLRHACGGKRKDEWHHKKGDE